MVLRLNDRPRILSLKDAFRNQVMHDPYRLVRGMFEQNRCKSLAHLLKGAGTVRQIASIPTVMLHSSDSTIQKLLNNLEGYAVHNELAYYARIAQNVAHMYHAVVPSSIESLAAEYAASESVRALPFAEFKHIYDVYRYANRQSRKGLSHTA